MTSIKKCVIIQTDEWHTKHKHTKEQLKIMSFIILTDGISDLDKDLREKYNIEYIPFMISCDNENGKEYTATLDWESFSAKEYYDRMRKGDQFRTTQIQIIAYEEYFTKYLSHGKDVLYVAVSSGLSGSYNASLLARDSVLEKFPDRKIVCVDTLRASGALGLMTIKAAQMRDEGKSMKEIEAWLLDNRLCYHQYGTVEDMVYLKRSGRITGVQHIMSKVLNIKPIIISNTKGENVSLTKVRGRKKALNKQIELLKENVIEPENNTLFIVHGDCLDVAEELRDDILKEVKFKDAIINTINPTVGATTGPGMIGVYFYGKKVVI